MNSLTPTQAAYVAGFLDGDGSIFVRLKPNTAYKYGFQVAPYVVFFQSQKGIEFLERLQGILGTGYVRRRKDGIAELTIGSMPEMRELLRQIVPYLLFKKRQAELLNQILELKEALNSKDDFLALAGLIDQFKELNYSKKRTITLGRVVNEFAASDNPVETCSHRGAESRKRLTRRPPVF